MNRAGNLRVPALPKVGFYLPDLETFRQAVEAANSAHTLNGMAVALGDQRTAEVKKMSAVLIPGSALPSAARRPRAGARVNPRLAACVLLVTMLQEAAVRFLPRALLLHPVQESAVFKQISGYLMVSLIVFAIAFGWLRRRPALSRHNALLQEIHQATGLLVVLLLGFHLGQTPAGFLLWLFHALVMGTAAGALRACLGARAGARIGTGLLGIHIALSCLALAGVFVHLYLVYVYTG